MAYNRRQEQQKRPVKLLLSAFRAMHIWRGGTAGPSARFKTGQSLG
jgi:hypothetical protein